MIYVLKIIWDYWVSLLELIVCNIARYPQSATLTSIRYQPAICYLLRYSHLDGWNRPASFSLPHPMLQKYVLMVANVSEVCCKGFV
jgi:hypothetical protein